MFSNELSCSWYMLLDMDVYHKLGCCFFLDGLNIDMCEHKYISLLLNGNKTVVRRIDSIDFLSSCGSCTIVPAHAKQDPSVAHT
jgi:hypothetical protein